MTGKCWRCGKRGHFAADCWKAEKAQRLHAVPDPVPEPVAVAEPDMDAYWDGTAPDLSPAYTYWDQVAPLPPPAAAWAAPRAAAPRTPAQIAREVRLMTLAAEQAAESRAARGML